MFQFERMLAVLHIFKWKNKVKNEQQFEYVHFNNLKLAYLRISWNGNWSMWIGSKIFHTGPVLCVFSVLTLKIC